MGICIEIKMVKSMFLLPSGLSKEHHAVQLINVEDMFHRFLPYVYVAYRMY